MRSPGVSCFESEHCRRVKAPGLGNMAIPLIYNVRNLRVRLGATVMTALGVALTVAIAIFIMALLAG